MKIGILTLFYNNANWGGVLQGYALKKHLEMLYPNATVDILKYRSGKNIVYSSKLVQALQYSPTEIIRKVRKRNNSSKRSIRALLARRFTLFDQFTDKCTTNQKVYTDSNLVHAAEEYDILICGSDQIWNPNVSKPGFYLSSIGKECLKVSYAASIARDDLGKRERKCMIPLISRFDFVSVREKTAKHIIQKYSNGKIAVEEVLDPALLLKKEVWSRIASDEYAQEEYALAFFFSDSLEYRKMISEFCKEKSMKLKFIMYAKNEYLATDEEGECDRLYDVGPSEFIALFQHARFVFTDSFHGTVFSLLFSKPFCVFERDKKSKVSKNSRLYDLLKKFDLKDRLIKNASLFNMVVDAPISFSKVEQQLEDYRKSSDLFLTNAISVVTQEKHEELKTVEDLKEYNCCGCGMCEVVCPQNCIGMIISSEGFYYPQIDKSKCVNCGKCIRECEKKNAASDSTSIPQCYIGFNTDERIRMNSSSGGLFFELGKVVIRHSGVVYGAGYNNDFEVCHTRVDALEQLEALQTSKYVQSKIEHTHEQVLADLKAGRQVLFVGTPCQVASIGRIADIHNVRDNLFLVDFICHGVPSPSVWKSYLTFRAKKASGKITEVSFRDKTHGTRSWHDYCMFIEYSNENVYSCSHDLDPYMQTFLSNRNLRLSCYDCQFKDRNYLSDITMGDAWKIERLKDDWADDKGTSVIIVRSKKGHELFEAVSEAFMYIESEYKTWPSYNPSLVQPSAYPVMRKAFFERYSQRKDDVEFWSQEVKKVKRRRTKYKCKRFLKHTKLERIVRKMI